MEVDNMALYLAGQIEKGKLDYVAVFSRESYKQFQTQVDDMLVVDGYSDLIQPIV